MNINFNVKISGGPRTPLSVETYCTAVNGRTLKFKNGETIHSQEISDLITNLLFKKLEEIEHR
jgi:hypothetical protein